MPSWRCSGSVCRCLETRQRDRGSKGVETEAHDEGNVRIDVLSLFGGASGDRPKSEAEHEELDLVVTGMALFAGVSVF